MHSSTGIIQFDPLKGTKHFDPGWVLLLCDQEIANYYAWHLKRYGIEVNTKSPWGIHISVVKGDMVDDSVLWGKYDGYEVEFNYNHIIRFDNGKHAWVDVYSEDLSAFRESLGLTPKLWYHLTVGRLVRPFPPLSTHF